MTKITFKIDEYCEFVWNSNGLFGLLSEKGKRLNSFCGFLLQKLWCLGACQCHKYYRHWIQVLMWRDIETTEAK